MTEQQLQHQLPLLLLRVATLPLDALAPLAAESLVPLLDELATQTGARDDDAAALGEALFRAAGAPNATAGSEETRRRMLLLQLRRDLHNRRLLDAELLRDAHNPTAPSLVADLERHRRLQLHHIGLHQQCIEAATAAIDQGRAALLRAAGDPLVEEGIGLASRSLLQRLRGLSRRPPRRWAHAERHVAGKALAYLARFATKTSPNGLFCATALAAFDEDTPALAGAPAIASVDTLLNVVEARKVAACLAIDPAIDAAVMPRPNPTLREEDGAWTFWKPASPRNADEDEVRSRVRDHPVVRAFLEEAAPHRNVAELIAVVAERTEVDRPAIETFYRQLVDRGILIGEVEIPYNTRRPLRALAEACRRAGCDPPWLPRVESVEDDVDALGDLRTNARSARMERVGRTLETLPHVQPLKPDELFRSDAVSALDVRLPRQMLDELRESLRVYVQLFSAMYPERIYRAALADRFLRSFPADTDINLLDLYHGAFEPGDQRRPAAFPDPAHLAPGAGAAEASRALARARELFARRAREARPGEEIEITAKDLEESLGPAAEPRWSSGVLFHVDAPDVQAIARGSYRLVLSALFQGTGMALARFAHVLGGGDNSDNPVVRELRRGWSCLEREGAILAELTYNHTYRTANAGLRPSIFEHEIELPGECASPGAHAIPLRELVVRWSSETERFVLRWTRNGTEIIPVINSGVNPVGVISFLVQIGQQGLQPLGLFPGFDVDGVTHWPRIVSGRTVLFRERFSFAPGQWPAAGQSRNEAESFVEVALWRRKHAIPRHVFAHTTADPKPRYFDLESPLFTELLQRTAGRADPGDLHLTEMLPGPQGRWIAGEHGRYASEFLVHLASA